MKITIEAEPEELAKMCAEVLRQHTDIIRDAEDRIGQLLLAAAAKKTKPEEVPNGGYFH